ncbi:MAG: hypothetical protein KKH68_10755 [Proteobacteria bacterium]|nr:hypothetical protein [Pseudomonadota bacterium]
MPDKPIYEELEQKILHWEEKSATIKACDRSLICKAKATQQPGESQSRPFHKLETPESLPGSIAHQFNNILGAIIGYTELAQENVPEVSPGQRYLAKVLDACGRAKELIDQLLESNR